MKKINKILLLALLSCTTVLVAQDTLKNAKSLNLPFEHYGISFGNSYRFTGIRLNFADENVEEINGINFTFWFKFARNMESVVNGINIGIIPTGGTSRGVNIGLFGVGDAHDLYGLNISGVVNGASGVMKGLFEAVS